MITEEYLKDNFLTAYFIDQERKNIEIQTTTEDKKKVFTTIIPFEEGHHQYEALKSVMSLDQLHESTYQKHKKERKLFEETVIRIAQKDGLIMDSERIDTADHVFALKLALFELKAVKESTNEEAKKELRKSKNKLDIIAAALQCMGKK